MSRYSRTDPSLSRLRDLQLPVELTPSAAPSDRFAWGLLSAIALTLCVADGLWLSQNFWLAQPGLRLAADTLLSHSDYVLKRPKLANAWQASALSLRAETRATQVWHIDALLVNRADILQPWPRLQLSLRDWQGQLVAQRVLLASDYLPADLNLARGPQALIASDQPVKITAALQLPVNVNGEALRFEQAELKSLP